MTMSRSDREVSVVAVAIGGYAAGYVRLLLDDGPGRNIRLAGAVDPTVNRRPRGDVQGTADELRARGVPLYDDLASFYRRDSADLAVIASPIHMHASQTCEALAAGSHVLCEKPLAATIQDARRMADAQAAAGRFVAVGYQWSFSPAIQGLKADILAGRLGRPIRLRTLVFWPRRRSYYLRNDWAGAVKSADGQWVLDSPANNATAHFLHNMFYVLGDDVRTGAAPADVQAELYRANDIANYDTAAIRCHTAAGTEVLYYTTHATSADRGPVFCYEFENATVSFGDPDERIVAHFTDGGSKDYGDPGADNMAKLWHVVDCVRTGAEPLCTIAAATPQTLAINGAQESAGGVTQFPAELVEVTACGDDRLTWAPGLYEQLTQCYDRGVLPSELGDIAWAQPGELIDLRGYDFFPAPPPGPKGHLA